MEITYDRDCSHCEPSNYIKTVTIARVVPAENSDRLDCITFNENGWQAIAQRGLYLVGDTVLFIVPESVLPRELSDILGVTQYLSKGRVKRVKLRGNRSEGLIVPSDVVAPYAKYILQWEDVPTVQMYGSLMAKVETPFEFEIFHKMPNLYNEPNILIVGELVSYSEKIHGTNCRFGFLRNPTTNLYELYVGTHRTVRKREQENPCLYWKSVEKIVADKNLPKDIVFYGEIYGKGIQHMEYGMSEQSLRVFAAMETSGRYLIPEFVSELCDSIGIETVKFHETVYEGLEWARELSNLPSELYNGPREGIVIVPHDNPKRMTKVIGDEYLEGKKSKGRTERH